MKPPEPSRQAPAWRVTLPDGPHIVAYENDKPRPSRLICDGRLVDVTWPFKWRGTPEAVFTVAGHRATLVEGPDLRKSLFGLGGPGSYVYRRDLRVDGASVESLDAVEPNPLQPFGVPAAASGQPGRSGHRRIGLLAGLAWLAVAVLVLVTVRGAPVAPTPSPSVALPSFMAGGFPHEDPGLEARMPESVGDLQLEVWSVRGGHILEVGGGDIDAVVTQLGRSIDDASHAVAGRSTKSEPPNWAFAYRVEGLSGEAIGDAFRANMPELAPLLEAQIIEGRTVLVADGGSEDMSVIMYEAADAFFMLLAPDLSSAQAMLRQVDRGSGE